MPAPSAAARAQPADDVLGAPTTASSNALPYSAYIHVPPKAPAGKPLQVVIALHGMNGEGKGFAGSLIKAADQHNWLLVAPTIAYGNWRDPSAVALEDIEIAERLNATIQRLPGLTGLKLKDHVKIFGFSRGAQVAHRFALSYPEDVSVVVAYSAGTYTLPLTSVRVVSGARPESLPFPYGIADLPARLGHPINFALFKQVRFLIGVGGNDNKPGDVPRQWDEYLGNTRLGRAEQFSQALNKSGGNCTLKVFPGVGHEITNDMLTQAEQFFAADEPLVVTGS
ncbi:MAG: hypothetical protein HZB53_12860 [Chloroflexi bacterium]|nr:hypothetical protein [Chloroflexota bacterium]